MKFLYVILVGGAILALRIALFRTRRRRRSDASSSEENDGRTVRSPRAYRLPRFQWGVFESAFGDVGLVAIREIRERVRGRIFRVGTVLILVVVAAAIVIPALNKSSGMEVQKVGIVGTLSPSVREVVLAAGRANQDSIRFVAEDTSAAAHDDVRSQKVDFAILGSYQILVDQPVDSSNSSADPGLVHDLAQYLGVLQAYNDAGLTANQVAQVSQAKPVPIQSLVGSSKSATKTTSIIGLVLLFFMLTQYCTWILIGVMQEKSSRVVEVLLATLRPLQLLGGKVLGIGTVALGQAALVVGFALALGEAVGSNLLHGSTPMTLLAELAWLVLGYAFYCWVYAAAGSTAERQDQVQTLALPLSIPILFGYIYSISVASSGTPNLFFKVLAYFPPTAPFCMSVLVGLSQVKWWEFLASVIISIAGTGATAVFASRIYRRAVLQTGARVRLFNIIGGATR